VVQFVVGFIVALPAVVPLLVLLRLKNPDLGNKAGIVRS